MLAKVQSAGLLGIEAFSVCAEVEVSGGLPAYHLVGLGAGAVKEGGVRVRAALEHSGWKLPPRRVTVNLAPADVRKDGAAYDLPVALGILAAQEKIPSRALEETLFLGELSLDGSLRKVAGSLPVALFARQQKFTRLVLPAECAGEAAAISNVTVLSASSLAEVAGYLNGACELQPAVETPAAAPPAEALDLSEVRGLAYVKFALEVAAAGGHNVLLVGAPGGGKSMLAARLPSILPALGEAEALETSAIYSAAGLLAGGSVLRRRPFRSPHHDISMAGLVGGGTVPRPGEISLAHNGVLFLDELPEFRRSTLEALRQPLEERSITIVRARATVHYPASFSLVAAMNPCPCGYYGSSLRACSCGLGQVQRYRGRLSGPLIDRFDIQVFVPHIEFAELTSDKQEETSAQVLERVEAARAIQQSRYQATRKFTNAHLGPVEIRRFCQLSDSCALLLERISKKRGMTARGVHRLLRVARTVADVRGEKEINREVLQGAIDLRFLDQEVVE